MLAALTARDGTGLDSLLEACRAQSLLSWRDGLTTVHALVAAVIAATNPPDAQGRAVSLAWDRAMDINMDDPVAFRREVAHFERLLALARAQFGPEDPRSLAFANNLAIGYVAVGRTAEAAKLEETSSTS